MGDTVAGDVITIAEAKGDLLVIGTFEDGSQKVLLQKTLP